MWWGAQSRKLIIIRFPLSSSLLATNSFLSALLSKFPSLWHSLNVRDQVLCPYKTKKSLYMFTF
jgi:hypothetical protein